MADEYKSLRCEECGGLIYKKRKQAKRGPQKPRFCSTACENRNWVKRHPRTKVPVEVK